MAKRSPWKRYYECEPGGRPCISRTQRTLFETRHRGRVLELPLKGTPSRVLLLDHPFRLGSRVAKVEPEIFLLQRVRLADLPGWPPKLPPVGGEPVFPNCLVCVVKAVTGRGEKLEFDLEWHGRAYKGWMSGCPAVLLRCVEATLEQEGAIDNRLQTLQELRLIGCG